MGRIIIDKNFTGYPDGVKTKFRAGAEAEVPLNFEKMVVDKGYAHRPARKSTAMPDDE